MVKLVELVHELLLHPPFSSPLLASSYLFPNVKISLARQNFFSKGEVIAKGVYLEDLQKTYISAGEFPRQAKRILH